MSQVPSINQTAVSSPIIIQEKAPIKNSLRNLKPLKSLKSSPDAGQTQTANCLEQRSRNNDNIAQTSQTAASPVIQENKTTLDNSLNSLNNKTTNLTPKPSLKTKWLLAASFHTNGGIGTNNTNLQSPAITQTIPLHAANALKAAAIYEPGDEVIPENRALVPDNVTGEYLVPLSFGLSVRKNINKHWGIETGLVYTYLSSNYRWTESTPFDATQQLHYLGIPVNGVVYLWNHPKWNVYFSAGAMLEKGLWMQTVRNQHLPERVITTTQKSHIDGLQWSLNSSAGISYRFTDKMKLYVEPRLGYYFNNNQPVSIRTDRPVFIGFGAGLQYSF